MDTDAASTGPAVPRFGPLLALTLAVVLGAVLPVAAQAADAGDAALTVSKKAYKAYKAGEYKRAAIMYRAAWHTNPKTLTYLYNAARASQLAGMLDEAERDYKRFIEKAAPGNPEVAKAWRHLGEIGEVREATRPRARKRRKRTPRPAPRPPPRARPKPRRKRHHVAKGAGQATAGWILIAAGSGAVIAGAVLLAKGFTDRSDLDARYKQVDPATGKIIGIDHNEATAETQKINDTLRLSYIVGGVGLAAVGVGAYLVSSAESSVAVLPGPAPRGLSIALRF